MSKTPRTDAAWKEAWKCKAAHPDSDPAHAMCDACEKLERELAEAHALLREWLVTELDSLDEDFEPWVTSFTQRIHAAIDAAEVGK